MTRHPSNDDLRVFLAVVRRASFAAAAGDLGASTAYVSKRIRLLEEGLGVRLLHRTTRTVAPTEDGERLVLRAQRVLDEVDALVQDVAATRSQPRGLLRISTSFGFGRNVVAPVISRMVERYPQLQVRLEVFDRLVDVAGEGFDLDVRVGDEIAPHLIARRLAGNHRLLCAAPAYLARRGAPRTLAELASHDCLVIKERDHPFGLWRLRGADGAGAVPDERVVKVAGTLSTNHGEVAVRWAEEGRGILLRSVWDVAGQLADGRLVPVLPQWRQDANVWAVYPSRLEASAKVRVCVDYLEQHFSVAAARWTGDAGAAPGPRPA
ncbi:MAG: LysR substrate-binding domain-containing protein [Xylophilus ampelinus]